MIVAEQKPLAEIRRMIVPYHRVLIIGCGTCMTVCYAGGEREVSFLHDALRLAQSKSENGSHTFWEYNFITYQEAGAFVRFLIDWFGIEKLKELCNVPDVDDELGTSIYNIYGLTLHELEVQWKEYLLQIDVPDVTYSIPENSEMVFSMEDPQGDDKGDGNYKYPDDGRFKRGVFDLRVFSVFMDSSRVYFRLEFQNMIDPVIYSYVGEKFVPGAVIAINKGDGEKRQVQKYFDGVKLEKNKGYDLKLTIGFGITVSDNYGKMYYTTGDIRNSILYPEEKRIEFSFPLNFIGEPKKNWQYFVGTGLMGDRTMHFTGGPMAVRRDHRLFIRGGNYDFGNPAFIDILLPEEVNQKKVLSEYDPEEGKLAVVPMVTHN